MEKNELVHIVRNAGVKEPTRVQWNTIWNICLSSGADPVEVAREVVNGPSIHDQRVIPPEYRESSMKLHELALWAKEMQKAFV